VLSEFSFFSKVVRRPHNQTFVEQFLSIFRFLQPLAYLHQNWVGLRQHPVLRNGTRHFWVGQEAFSFLNSSFLVTSDPFIREIIGVVEAVQEPPVDKSLGRGALLAHFLWAEAIKRLLLWKNIQMLADVFICVGVCWIVLELERRYVAKWGRSKVQRLCCGKQWLYRSKAIIHHNLFLSSFLLCHRRCSPFQNRLGFPLLIVQFLHRL